MFNIKMILLALLASLICAAAQTCSSHNTKSHCLAENCHWCSSDRLGGGCMEKDDADKLPTHEFTCGNSATLGASLSDSACSVANYFRNAGFPESTIGTMVCIAKWESSWNCGALNHNTDGSTDYGLAQINSYYWCSGDAKSKYNSCNASCNSLLNCQANANCAHLVYKQQGFNAWYGYKAHKSECDSAKPPC
jgi:hypothetical protein